MYFVAFVGQDQENWGQITALMRRLEAEKVVLIAQKGAAGFPVNEKCALIEIDSSKPIVELKALLTEKLRAIVGSEFDVALSLASGNGKEHLALLAALLSVPVGVRLVAYTKEGVQFLT